MPGMDQPLNSEKDIPLRQDIRLLGRILGDTVRSQEGDAVFDVIEGIRQSSIRFRRDEDQVARRELEAALNRLSRNENDPDHPRIQLFLPPREHRRGPAPHPKDPRACGRFSSARGQHRSRARPRAESWDRTFRPPEVLRERSDLPGSHRAPDGGEAKEHH